MARDWREVKEEIERDIDRIWWEEPEEVTMSKLGIFPSGASVGGQAFGNMFFQVADTQALGWWTAEPAMRYALGDPTFTLEHLKRMWKYISLHMAKLMGDTDPPNCPAPWLNLPKLSRFAQDIVDSFESIKTRGELEDLLWSWFNYVNCLNRWFFLVFPWHLGEMFPLVKPEDVERLAKLHHLEMKDKRTSG
jgi:hypothetical protein